MLDKMIESVDYEMIPSAEAEIEQAWDIRILRGDYTETVLRFGNIAFDGENDCLNFNFMVVSSPSDADEDDVYLQETAGAILQSLLEEAVKAGSLVLGDPNSEEQSED